ncbi:MAG: hypothetical protein KGH55_03625 [Nanoarchaeota archaeon]|nr:hypothetical protein [Nanoarchaeota archaeon]
MSKKIKTNGGKMEKEKDLNKLSFAEFQTAVEEMAKKKESTGKVAVKDSPFVIGENYLIRTVTMIYTGRLTKVFEKELVIADAAWIPETERWADSVAKGTFKEVEPYPDGEEVILNREAVLDTTKVRWKLPRSQK